jgi:membrane dipeptidase
MTDIIVDAHLDIAMNHIGHGREFRNPSWKTQHIERKFPGAPYADNGVASVGLPDMLLGRVAICFATIWVDPGGRGREPSLAYETPHQAYQHGLRQLDYYNRLGDEDDRIRLIRNQSDLQTVLDSWGPETQFADHKLGIVVLMEGADPIIEPKQVEEWYERGVRIIGPAWQATRYAAGTGEPGPLTSLGRELLDVMGDLNMILDLSHLAEEAYFQAVEIYDGPLLASHSNPRRFVDSDRQLSDDMIRRLAERDSVMGIVAYNRFLKQGWKPETDKKSDVTVGVMLDMIDHVCQLTGSARHVGIGTDWDGGFGWESIPTPFDSHIDLWLMRDFLLKRQYHESDVTQILSGNFLRILKQGLPT